MTAVTRAAVYAAIDSERAYQEMRIVRDGSTSAHTPHEPEAYIIYMEDYLTEARRVASHTWGPESKAAILEVLRKVVALGVACMEAHGAPQRSGFKVSQLLRETEEERKSYLQHYGHATERVKSEDELFMEGDQWTPEQQAEFNRLRNTGDY